MTDQTDRIKQMAQEAGFHLGADVANEHHPDGVFVGEYWISEELAKFAALVAEDCARVAQNYYLASGHAVAEAANQGESVEHVLKMCAAGAAFAVVSRYGLKGE